MQKAPFKDVPSASAIWCSRTMFMRDVYVEEKGSFTFACCGLSSHLKMIDSCYCTWPTMKDLRKALWKILHGVTEVTKCVLEWEPPPFEGRVIDKDSPNDKK